MSLDDNDILVPFHRWLHKMAVVYMPWNPNYWEDLAQEGYIAMWRAMKTYDPAKGSLPSWLTGAARLRMKDCARRETWTGSLAKRGHVREKPALPIDPHDYEMERQWEEMAEGIILAYHHGEVRRVLSGFTPSVQQALYRRFWLDKPVPHGYWTRAIPVLKDKLAHLGNIYE